MTSQELDKRYTLRLEENITEREILLTKMFSDSSDLTDTEYENMQMRIAELVGEFNTLCDVIIDIRGL